MTLAQLNKGEKAVIEDLNTDLVPLKLIEMGCLPGNQIELLQLAPFKGPLFLNVNDAQVAIRKETAEHIQVKRTAE
ncbi:MAG: FeoA family protein [Flavobacteriaceae bacterium]